MRPFSVERADVALPRIMGHELSGIVKEVGSEVSHLVPGDHVVFDPVVACGQCKTCLSGHQNVCPDVCCFGVQMDGGFQDYIVVNAANLYRISKNIPFPEAALAEPYSVGANILANQKINRKEDGWEIFYNIPFSFIKQFFPNFIPIPGKILRANFYKCGDLTKHPHYYCWSVPAQKPHGFHSPECFGILEFGEKVK